jgi:hypothetical protein
VLSTFQLIWFGRARLLAMRVSAMFWSVAAGVCWM